MERARWSVSQSNVSEACCFLSVPFKAVLPPVHDCETPSVHAINPAVAHDFQQCGHEGCAST